MFDGRDYRPLKSPPDGDQEMKLIYKIKLYWEMNDAEVESLYEIGFREKALDHVIYDIRADRKIFLIFTGRAEVFGAVYDTAEAPMGFFYLDSFEGSTARIHFCFFKAGRGDCYEIGRQVLKWCFETFDFKCIRGIVPAFNVGVIRYAHKLGGRFRGFIPGNCWIERLKRSMAGAQFIFTRSVCRQGPEREAN